MGPRLENRRIRLPHRAHHQIMNQPLNVRPHLQPAGLLWGHANRELWVARHIRVWAYQLTRLDGSRGHPRLQGGMTYSAVHGRPKRRR